MKIYQSTEPEIETKKEIILALKNTEEGVELNAVNTDGSWVAYLLTIDKNGLTTHSEAKWLLDKNGYDTSELPWDADGVLKVYRP